jgi:hypothetical protein
MKRPFRESLELDTDSAPPRVLCARCGFVFGGEADWRQHSHRKLSPPTAAGPLMKDLVGQFLLEQLFCPSCKTLLDSEIVEAPG